MSLRPAAAGSSSGIRGRERKSGRWKCRCRRDRLTGARSGSLVWSADGKYLAAAQAGRRGHRRHGDPQENRYAANQRLRGDVLESRWGAPGDHHGTAGSPQDVEVWDISTGKKVVWHCHSAESHSLSSLAWSPDGSRVALGEGEGLVTIWDTATAKRLLVLPDRAGEMEVSSVAWSPDGRRLASGSWETERLTIWDTATAKRLLVLPGRAGPMGVSTVAWSPDGRRLASVGNSGQKNVGGQTVKVWDTSDGHEMLTLVGHTQRVNCMAWTRDGKRLATAGADITAKIWDPSSGQELFSLAGYCLAWSPDGKQLAVGQEGTIRFYDASSGYALARGPGHPAEANRRRAPRTFIVSRTRHGNETTLCCFLQSRKGIPMFDNVRYLTRGARPEGRSRKPRQHVAPHHRRLVCEVLEARTLLSASPFPFVQQAKLRTPL